MNISQIRKASATLHSYMNFRAKEEGMRHELPTQFYAAALGAGVRIFFGIQVDDATGRLAGDTQNPAAFAAYFASHTLTG